MPTRTRSHLSTLVSRCRIELAGTFDIASAILPSPSLATPDTWSTARRGPRRNMDRGLRLGHWDARPALQGSLVSAPLSWSFGMMVLRRSRYHRFTRAHRTLGRGRSGFSRVVPLAAYGLYAIDTALHSASLRQLSGDPRSRSVPPAQTSL